MFTKEEKEKAKNFKFSFRPLDELEQYLHSKFLSVIDQNSISDKGNDLGIIPKHIMLFWHSEQLPEDVHNSINKIRQYNSEYKIQIFNEKSAGEFIQQYYGSEFYHLYERRCVHFTMKSDFFRICYLAQKGGIYIDVDVDCHNALEEIFKFCQFNCFFFFSKGKPYCIDNDFIVCQPNNPIILAILEKIKENLTQKRSFSSVWECTGPGAVSIVILELLMQDILADCCSFSPLKNLKLGNRDLAIRAYSPADLNYKKTVEGNWRRFRLPKHLHLL